MTVAVVNSELGGASCAGYSPDCLLWAGAQDMDMDSFEVRSTRKLTKVIFLLVLNFVRFFNQTLCYVV